MNERRTKCKFENKKKKSNNADMHTVVRREVECNFIQKKFSQVRKKGEKREREKNEN